MSNSMLISAVLSALLCSSPALAQLANTFKIVGNTGVSAQQMFLGTAGTVYIVDKTENNPLMVDGHPAWAASYDLASNTVTADSIRSNTFCAGGNQMGNGSWINIGGNNAVTTLGVSDSDVGIAEGAGPYQDVSGGHATRIVTPNCAEGSCTWTEDVNGIPISRWYPTVETLEDGSVIIIGGELYGGFVNSVNQKQSNPTYEFWPTTGAPISSSFLLATQPANLYPLTWLLPSGLLFMQANWQTTLLNYTSYYETPLPNITHAQKTYPASGATAMLPLTKENAYLPTLLFCGGMDPVRDDWDQTLWAIANTDTSASCVSINPMDPSPVWSDDDTLPENRGMGNFIQLPDQRLLLINGVGKGSAGYGYHSSWAINQSYAQNPVTRPAYYNHSAPAGSRFEYADLPDSTIGRLYHSSATLLPDGSVLVAGSNPNSDVITMANNATYVYKTEYRSEVFYPDYYDAPRPAPTGVPTTISYGGLGFDLILPASSINGANLNTVKVALVRTGFSTHSMNMGMRYVQLDNSYTGHADGSATIHVSQLPPSASVLVPGPALFFVVVNGIPSVGVFVMVGNGVIGSQLLSAATVLPQSVLISTAGTTSSAPAPSVASATASTIKPAATTTTASKSSASGLRSSLGGMIFMLAMMRLLL